jgi:hypothetical protein
MSVCFYCRNPKTSISVCLDCRLKQDRLARDLAEARRKLAYQVDVNGRLMSALKRAIRTPLKPGPAPDPGPKPPLRNRPGSGTL